MTWRYVKVSSVSRDSQSLTCALKLQVSFPVQVGDVD